MESMKEYNFRIGSRIKKIREARALKQGFVAEKLGLSTAHYSNIENGRRTCTLRTLISLCNILDVSPNDLLKDCVKVPEEEPKLLFLEMSECLNGKNRDFFYEFESLFCKYYGETGETAARRTAPEETKGQKK